MANTDKDILITPNIGSSTDDPKIEFSGADAVTAAQTITLRVYPDSNGTVSFEGSSGQLLSITNDMTGTIFSVNDISGIPSLEINADGAVDIAEFGGDVTIGHATDSVVLVPGILTTPAIESATGKISLLQNTMTTTQGALSCGTNFHIDSRNDASKIYLNYYGGTGGVVIGDGAAGTAGTLVAGAITGTSFGGITSANLVDKNAAEIISSEWRFAHADGFLVDNSIHSGYLSGTHTTAFGATMWAMGKAYTGSDYGDAYAATSVYGISYLRATHTLATAFGTVGEGLYVIINGVVQAGIGATGIKTDGAIVAVGDITGNTGSDIRLKENILPIDNALDKVMMLSGKSFNFIDESKSGIKGNQYGFMAHAVEGVLPELVTNDKDGFKQIRNGGFEIEALLVESIKELKHELDELKTKIAELKGAA